MARKVFGEIVATGTVAVWVSGPISTEVLECLESFIAHQRKQQKEEIQDDRQTASST